MNSSSVGSLSIRSRYVAVKCIHDSAQFQESYRADAVVYAKSAGFCLYDVRFCRNRKVPHNAHLLVHTEIDIGYESTQPLHRSTTHRLDADTGALFSETI